MRAALYARVSSDRQEQEDTIQSQLEELRTQVREDEVIDWLEVTDEGYGRDNLVRPGLDRVRDLGARGEIDHLYIQCPDRLASGARLVLLVEELQGLGIEVTFLRGSVEDTPEGKLLLHLQGAIAEYESIKIAERTRRGKLYWARQGAMVGGHAPFGFRFIRRTDTDRARLEVDGYRASVVREMYRWLVDEALSTRAIAKRLTEQGVPTARGAVQWQPTAVARMLRNTAYKGDFVYCRYENVTPARRVSDDPYRQNRKTGRKPRSPEDWITIPVPAIVDEATWLQAQEQLRQNSLFSRRNNRRNKYLLRGLVRCLRCGSKYAGVTQHGKRRYRCMGHDASISSTGKRCAPGSFLAEPVEQAVWAAVTEAMRGPVVLVEEYEQRLKDVPSHDEAGLEGKQVGLALKRVKKQEDRVTDAYINEAMELERYSVEMDKLRERLSQLERIATDIERREQQQTDRRMALERLEQFCREVSNGLDAMTFEERQQLLRLVVERVTVEDDRVRIETVIPTGGDDVQLRAHHPESL